MTTHRALGGCAGAGADHVAAGALVAVVPGGVQCVQALAAVATQGGVAGRVLEAGICARRANCCACRTTRWSCGQHQASQPLARSRSSEAAAQPYLPVPQPTTGQPPTRHEAVSLHQVPATENGRDWAKWEPTQKKKPMPKCQNSAPYYKQPKLASTRPPDSRGWGYAGWVQP